MATRRETVKRGQHASGKDTFLRRHRSGPRREHSIESYLVRHEQAIFAVLVLVAGVASNLLNGRSGDATRCSLGSSRV
jgi:hypothetical protein